MVFSRGTLTAQILDAAPYAVIVADHGGAIVYANAQAEVLFGWSMEDLLRVQVDTLVPAASRAGHAAQRASYSRQPHVRPMGAAREIRATRKDGSVFPADIMLSPVVVDDRHLVFAMIRDDTERRENERRLAAMSADLAAKNDELEARNKELEAFAFTASHDLQEPLRKITAFGDRLARRAGTGLDDTSRDYLGRMLDASRRMQTLIEDLLAWSRIATRAGAPVRVDLDALVGATLRDLEIAIERSHARVEVGSLPAVEGDVAQMRVLFQNLIDNALKYRKADVDPIVTLRAQRIEGPPAMIRIEVTDNGIGFDPKYRDRIFEIFERLHARHEYEGTGIGLALCRKIAERHGGTITATSAPGEGSTFVVTLRAAPDTRETRT